MDYLQYCTLPFVSTFENLVLNLIINGLPSIRRISDVRATVQLKVLNLIINGLPSILKEALTYIEIVDTVLNLIINGLPSIQTGRELKMFDDDRGF